MCFKSYSTIPHRGYLHWQVGVPAAMTHASKPDSPLAIDPGLLCHPLNSNI